MSGWLCVSVLDCLSVKSNDIAKEELRGIFQPYLGPCGTFSILNNRERLFINLVN